MAHSSRRPLATYSRRRALRRRASDVNTTQSSPIRPLSPDGEDVPFDVMANRMSKRARLVSHSIDSEGGISESSARNDTVDRPSKRQKPTPTSDEDSLFGSDYMRDGSVVAASQFCTPQVSAPSHHYMQPTSSARPTPGLDQPSPLPLARRTITRTTSRNFKENAGERYLASPFHSRPGSRTSSPDRNARGPRKRLAHHVKSRTLSGALREKTVDRNIAQHWPEDPSSRSHTVAAGPEAGTQVTTMVPAHSRSSSTPAMKPALDDISPDAWLVLPNARSRSSPIADPDNEFDPQDTAVNYPSFFVDAPQHISTPPRRRRSVTVGVWAHGLMPQLEADPPPPIRSFRYDSDVDMSDSSCPGSPSDSKLFRADPPRRRRRTIVHLPSDSLFSSSLDFSTLMSETGRFPRPPASEGSRSPEQHPPMSDLELEPAFSLNNSPIIPSYSSKSQHSSAGLRRSLPVPQLPSTSSARRTVQPSPLPSFPSSAPPPAQASLDTDGDELLELFSILGLDGECRLRKSNTFALYRNHDAADIADTTSLCLPEDEKWNASNADDSGVAFAIPRSYSHDSKSSSRSVDTFRATRKRGDTIRASDYVKPPFLGYSGSFDSASTAGSSSAQRIVARRTRSGTVTQANSSGNSRRKHEGWPTIKMRTNPEPLRAEGSEDDELLLKDGDVIE